MDARKSEKILYICTGICCLLIIGGGALTALELPGMTALIVVGIMVLLYGTWKYLLYHRCPHCGTFFRYSLLNTFHPRRCHRCGKDL